MATKLLFPFPIFAPPNSSVPQHRRPVTEIRFSRWNNAKAEPFNLRKRAQQEIENDIRRHRRFDSASNIATIYENATATTTTITTTTTFKSIGTPSSPSKPSIPGKRSKYSKNPNSNHNSQSSHPAFRRIRRTTKIDRHQQRNQKNDNNLSEQQSRVKPSVEVSEDGVSYKVDGLPFEMMYSYTETPKAKPIALREPPFSPFGPQTMARPWTGRAPLPESKKKLKEFDSFVLPPPHKKGVKPVQAPGPFLPGSGPKYVKSREEILGEALTHEEVKELVKSCLKSTRQLNIGRDGLTHNMLDNIHAHWKRKRVCKIKCKGVCTVDMDNVRRQLEEKTGGKIIYSRGGVLFLFRGRNYNYRTRPRFPIMLWKPVTPVYPRLVKRAPEGLTLEKAGEMRKKGRELIPICKLAKNGVYSDLVRNVREAFEACELVRINCQGLNGSDYRKIGAKLKDLVPCVLISFEHEHILMWRGNDWKSSLPNKEDDGKEAKEFKTDDPTSIVQSLEEHEISSSVSDISVPYTSRETLSTSILVTEDEGKELSKDLSCNGNNMQVSSAMKTSGSGTILNGIGCADDESKDMRNTHASETISGTTGPDNEELAIKLVGSDVIKAEIGSSETLIIGPITEDKLRDVAEVSYSLKELTVLKTRSTEGVLLLLKQALEGGNAIILDNVPLDADTVYERAVAFSKSAPPGPVFRHRPRKVAVQRWEKKGTGDLKANEVVAVPEKRASQRKSLKSQRMNEFKGDDLDVMPKGSLRVDELAKLLA